MEWEELLARLQKYNSVALRVDNGQTLVDELASVKLNTKNGRIPDMDETKVISLYIVLYQPFFQSRKVFRRVRIQIERVIFHVRLIFVTESHGKVMDLKRNGYIQVVEEISTNWIASSNYRVSLLGIDLLDEVVRSLGHKFKAIITKGRVNNLLIEKCYQKYALQTIKSYRSARFQIWRQSYTRSIPTNVPEYFCRSIRRTRCYSV